MKNWTKEKMTEYNKLCAEFLGAKPCKDWQGEDGYEHPSWYHTQWSNKFQDELELYSYRYSQLQFDSDWNWIHEVIEAIERIEETSKNYGALVDITTTYVRVGHFTVDLKLTPMAKKEAVVQAIYEFLIWYNEQGN